MMDNVDFNNRLRAWFPNLRESIASTFDYYGDDEPGIYLTFEQVLVPAIEEAGSINPTRLQALMNFVERVAQEEPELVRIGLEERLPSLINERQIREAAGPITKRIVC